MLMLKDKHACVRKEVVDELFSLGLTYEISSAAGRGLQVDSPSPLFLSFSRSVVLAMPHQSLLPW